MKAKFDSIPFPNKLKTLFVLESPHKDEICLGYPAAGQSGLNMSRAILSEDKIPFGQLLQEKDERVSEFGIFNSCQFPLGMPEKLSTEELRISAIKDVSQSKNRFDNYKLLAEFLVNIEDLDNEIQYKERFKRITQDSPNLETIVFCGFIAQAIFLKLYPKVSIPPYNKPVELNSKKIHFVNHPSELDSQWVYKVKQE